MVNVKLSFTDKEQENELQVYCNTNNEIFLGINFEDFGNLNTAIIALNIDTAIKFSKELRKQIAIAKELILNSEDNE